MEALMRKGLIIFLLIASVNAEAQLSYIGQDKSISGNGYTKEYSYVGGFAELKGKFYFSTPNSRFYETDGTQKGTKNITSTRGDLIQFVNTTNKYVYFAPNDGGAVVNRYEPVSGSLSRVRLMDNPNVLEVNGYPVPGYARLVDQEFISFEKDKITFRTFRDNLLRIRTIYDNDQPSGAIEVAAAGLATAQYPDYLIGISTQVASIRSEMFWNGIAYSYNKQKGENTVTSSKLPANGTYPYKYDKDYRLLDKGYYIRDGFLRTAKSLYVLAQNNTRPAAPVWQLIEFTAEKAVSGSGAMSIRAADYMGEVIDGIIYVTCQGAAYKFNEITQQFLPVLQAGNIRFDAINEKKRLLKAGDYMMFRQGDSLTVFNENNKILSNVIKRQAMYPLTSRFNPEQHHAFAGTAAFYYLSGSGETSVFNQYNPATQVTRQIAFPKIGKEKFMGFKAVYNQAGTFLILAEYSGDKKYGPSYQMFIYREQLN